MHRIRFYLTAILLLCLLICGSLIVTTVKTSIDRARGKVTDLGCPWKRDGGQNGIGRAYLATAEETETTVTSASTSWTRFTLDTTKIRGDGPSKDQARGKRFIDLCEPYTADSDELIADRLRAKYSIQSRLYISGGEARMSSSDRSALFPNGLDASNFSREDYSKLYNWRREHGDSWGGLSDACALYDYVDRADKGKTPQVLVPVAAQRLDGPNAFFSIGSYLTRFGEQKMDRFLRQLVDREGFVFEVLQESTSFDLISTKGIGKFVLRSSFPLSFMVRTERSPNETEVAKLLSEFTFDTYSKKGYDLLLEEASHHLDDAIRLDLLTCMKQLVCPEDAGAGSAVELASICVENFERRNGYDTDGGSSCSAIPSLLLQSEVEYLYIKVKVITARDFIMSIYVRQRNDTSIEKPTKSLDASRYIFTCETEGADGCLHMRPPKSRIDENHFSKKRCEKDLRMFLWPSFAIDNTSTTSEWDVAFNNNVLGLERIDNPSLEHPKAKAIRAILNGETSVLRQSVGGLGNVTADSLRYKMMSFNERSNKNIDRHRVLREQHQTWIGSIVQESFRNLIEQSDVEICLHGYTSGELFSLLIVSLLMLSSGIVAAPEAIDWACAWAFYWWRRRPRCGTTCALPVKTLWRLKEAMTVVFTFSIFAVPLALLWVQVFRDFLAGIASWQYETSNAKQDAMPFQVINDVHYAFVVGLKADFQLSCEAGNSFVGLFGATIVTVLGIVTNLRILLLLPLAAGKALRGPSSEDLRAAVSTRLIERGWLASQIQLWPQSLAEDQQETNSLLDGGSDIPRPEKKRPHSDDDVSRNQPSLNPVGLTESETNRSHREAQENHHEDGIEMTTSRVPHHAVG